MIYYLSRDYKSKRLNDAGSKARLDIEQTMDRLGFSPAGRHHSVSKNKLCHFVRTLAIVLRMLTRVGRGDVLIVQYPAKYYSTVCRLAHLRGAKVVTLMHDLISLRIKHSSIQGEIDRLNKSDAVIGHNPTFCQWLCDHGYVGHDGKRVIEPLRIFDFLSDSRSPNRKSTWPLRKVVYAGQLARRKNSFLYELGRYVEGYTLNVYGRGFDKSTAECPEKFEIKGFMPPDKLISEAEGDFGLVWDGDSVDTCSGDWGEYLKVNTPHKISLYIRCGLPVIVWREAAMAGFIEENGIGFCIDSLRDIKGIYERLTREEYERMCDNVRRVSGLLSEGGYFSRAISAVLPRVTV